MGAGISAPTDIAAFNSMRAHVAVSVVGVLGYALVATRATRTHVRLNRFRLFLLAIAALASALVADRASIAQEAKSEGRSELVLTSLPPKGSKAYKDLFSLAGKEANGQVLRFTRTPP